MGRPINATVNTSINLRLVVAGETVTPVPVDLRYLASDPYAVHATFHTAGEEVSWVFARDLLAEGLHSPAGQGDVRVWPSKRQDGDVILLSLSSPDGQALLEASAEDVADFLGRTHSAVPEGSEGSCLDLDGVISALLAA